MNWQPNFRKTLQILLASAIHGLAVFLCSQNLPARVAISFGRNGEPGDWVDRSSFLATLFWAPIIFAGSLLLLIRLTRKIPARMLNVPKADFWRRPENLPTSWAIVDGWSWNFCFVMLLFLDGLSLLCAEASRQIPPHLNDEKFNWLLGFFLVAMTTLTTRLLLRFNRASLVWDGIPYGALNVMDSPQSRYHLHLGTSTLLLNCLKGSFLLAGSIVEAGVRGAFLSPFWRHPFHHLVDA